MKVFKIRGVLSGGGGALTLTGGIDVSGSEEPLQLQQHSVI